MTVLLGRIFLKAMSSKGDGFPERIFSELTLFCVKLAGIDWQDPLAAMCSCFPLDLCSEPISVIPGSR